MNKDSILKEQEDDIKIEEEKKHVSIVMEKEGGVEWPVSIKEMIIERDENGEFKLSDIMIKVKKQHFHDFFDSSVSYYHA